MNYKYQYNNEDLLQKLLSLIKQGIVKLDDIKIQGYKDAVQAQLTA